MKCIIQTIPDRLELAKKQREALGLPCDIHNDIRKTNAFNGFVDSLNAFDYGDEYRFHMQDDLVLCDDLKDYLPEVERIMRVSDMNLMSLYAPRYRVNLEANQKGKRWIKSISAFAMQAVVLSPKLVKLLIEDAHYYKGWKFDDWFVTDLCRHYKIGTYVHIPSLTQHDVFNIPSSLGHANHERRTSHTFEPDFVKRWKYGKVKNP